MIIKAINYGNEFDLVKAYPSHFKSIVNVSTLKSKTDVRRLLIDNTETFICMQTPFKRS